MAFFSKPFSLFLPLLVALTLGLGFSPVVRADEPVEVLFFTVDAGKGHEMIEKAIKTPLDKSAPDYGMNISKDSVMLNDHLGRVKNFFWHLPITIGQIAPKVWEKIYNGSGKANPEVERVMYKALLNSGLVEALTRSHPKMIVTTFPLVPKFIDILKEEGKIDPKLKVVQIVTDYSVTQNYLSRGLIIVPHPSLKDKLVAMGKDPSLVKVVEGIPAGPAYLESYSKEAARAELNASLSAELKKPNILGLEDPLILATGGGLGLGLNPIADFLPKWKPTKPVKLVVVCGSNKEMLRRFETLQASGKLDPNITLIPKGYTQLAPYVKAATLIISKPGGSQTAEAIASKTALFAHTFIPGQESNNYEHLSKIQAIGKLDLNELNDMDKMMKRVAAVKAGIEREFPNARQLPKQIAEILGDYAHDRIRDNPAELSGILAKKDAIAGKPPLGQRIRCKLSGALFSLLHP